MQLADLSYTDVGESLEDMKARAAHRHLDTRIFQTARLRRFRSSSASSPPRTIFVFDQARTLRYQGRIDDSKREDASVADARNAIEALLAGRPVAAARTRASGARSKVLASPADPRQPGRDCRQRTGRRSRWPAPTISNGCGRTAPASCC